MVSCATFFRLLSLLLLIPPAFAGGGGGTQLIIPHALEHWLGPVCILIFIGAYLLVMLEEYIHLRKSKPVILTAGIIWAATAYLAHTYADSDLATAAVRHNILEYAELFLFLLVAMTYVNTLEERQVFELLRSWLVRQGYSYRQLFWVTGILAFFISPVADNLTTSLIMCAVVLAVGKENKRFMTIGCINIVVSANAGGAFSPFGDITTLMVWQKGLIPFFDFLYLFIPSVVSYLIPAGLMHYAIPNGQPPAIKENVKLLSGAKTVIGLFLFTITLAICAHNFLHLPPVLGMMTGFSLLQLYSYYLQVRKYCNRAIEDFDVFQRVERAEWDTLFFFYGIILCVGGLATMGYLEIVSSKLYLEWGSHLSDTYQATPANVMVGVLSAIVDNIPVMFAVLTMYPEMSEGQWLLVTLTAGIGGSLLSIGSAAGVALMGQAKGIYTFVSHLRWTWAIGLGYAAGIICHMVLNKEAFYRSIEPLI